MSCVNCSNGIEKVVSKMDGLDSSQVNFTSNSGEFYIDTQKLDKLKLIAKIKKLGYGVQEDVKELEMAKKRDYIQLRWLFLVSLVFTILLFLLMFFPLDWAYNSYVMLALASVVQFYPGMRFYSLAYKALSHKNSDMNVLVALGTTAAYLYSTSVVLFPSAFPAHLRFIYFDGACVIITFVLLGRLLEERSREKATEFLKSLMDLAPDNANLILSSGEVKSVLAKELDVKDIVLIKQGEKVSTDALIIKGEAEIDLSMLSGESMPVLKKVGDEVLAGTVVKVGTLHVEVQKLSCDTTLSHIISLLNEAGSRRLPIARLADRIANIFVPSVVAISIVTFLVWYFVVGDSFGAVLASISVLIISCPCALGLATPIAIVSSVGKGAKEGILIKNPEILEIIKDIKYAVFDKTGTLTKGEISVKDMLVEERYIALIACVEQECEHPISQAIVRYAKKSGVVLNQEVESLKSEAGLGVSASCQNHKVLVGNLALMSSCGVVVRSAVLEQFDKILDQGYGAVLASVDGDCVGVISLEDTLKDGVSELIKGLKHRGIVSIMLTGDNEITAKKVASEVGIDLVYAEVMPDEKYKLIKELQESSRVMFVGDGINDSISIKQADIGIALNSGSDITKEAGDIILINNEIGSVLKSINLSTRTMRTIKQNLFWAFFYNAIGIPLAAGVFYPLVGVMLSPMFAGVAMSFSSVTVVLNSLRLKFAKL